MATPALLSIRKGYPTVQITLLTTPQVETLANFQPFVDEILTFDLRRYRPERHGIGWGSAKNFWQLTRQLRLKAFDLVISLHQMTTTGAFRLYAFLTLIQARQNAGRWNRGLGLFFGIRANDRPHEVDAMLAITTCLGCPHITMHPILALPEFISQMALTRLLDIGLSAKEPFIILNIGSNRPEARLPEDVATSLAGAIRQFTEAPFVLTGDAREAAAVRSIASRIGGRCYSLAGQTSMAELTGILAAASVVVTTDTGPMHIAAALGTPLVALFGPASPVNTGPRTQPGLAVVLEGQAQPRHPLRWHRNLRLDVAAEAVSRFLTSSRVAGRIHL